MRASSGSRPARLGLLLLLAGCSRAPVSPASAPRQVTLLVSAGLQGQLEPFSDPKRTAGGLSRVAGLVAAARARTPDALWVDLGDALFGRSDLTDEWLPQSERRARAIAEAYTAMGNDAFAVGERDLLLGPDFLRASGLRALLNAGRGPDSAPAATLRDAGGVKVALLAASGREPAGALVEQAGQARGDGAQLVVALVHATAESAQLLVDRLPAGTVDLALAGHQPSELVSEGGALAGHSPVFTVPGRGRSLLRLDVALGSPGRGVVAVPSAQERRAVAARAQAQLREAEASLDGPVRDARIAALRQRMAEAGREPAVPRGATAVSWELLRVEPGAPEDASVGQIVDRCERDLQALGAGSDKGCGPSRRGQPAYLGLTGACAGCHPAAAEHWKNTPHARALATLAVAGRDRDLECARCHLTGLFAPGGVCRLDAPQGREGVQCEACHGPASLHAEAPSRGALLDVTEQTCKACHTADHAPGFRYDQARSRVLGPGHGESR